MEAEERICPTVLVAGFKGALFVAGILEAGARPLRIVSYPQQGDKSDSFNQLVELGRKHGIPVEESRHPSIAGDSASFSGRLAISITRRLLTTVSCFMIPCYRSCEALARL